MCAVAFDPKGGRIATGGFDGTVRFWDAVTFQPVSVIPNAHTVPTEEVYDDRTQTQTIAFSPDGTLLASAHDSAVQVLDVANGRPVFTLSGHAALVNAVAFSPDGSRLLSCSNDNTIKLWDPAARQEVFTLRGHTSGVLAASMSRDGQRIASGSIDKTLRIWDISPTPGEGSPRERASALMRYADEAFRKKRFEVAIRTLDQVIASEPTDLAACVLRSRALAEAGRDEEASAELKRADLFGLKDIGPWVEVGRSSVLRGNLDRAEAVLEQSLAFDRVRPGPPPADLPPVLRQLADARLAKGDVDKALRAYALAIEAYENHFRDGPQGGGLKRMIVPVLLHMSGTLQERARRMDQAVILVEKARDVLRELARTSPSDVSIRRGMATCLIRLGRYRGPTAPAAALAELEEGAAILEGIGDLVATDLVNLAIAHAQRSAIIGQRATDGGPPAVAEATASADRAMGAIRKAIAAGLPSPLSLKTNPGLAPLRPRRDFQLLMMDLAMPADPFTR